MNFTRDIGHVENSGMRSSATIPTRLLLTSIALKSPPANLYERMEEELRKLDDSATKELADRAINWRPSGVFESHPTTGERLAYAKQFEARPRHIPNDSQVTTLFTQWDVLTRTMSALCVSKIRALNDSKLMFQEKILPR